MGDDEEGERKVGMLKFDQDIDMTVLPAGADGEGDDDDEEDLEGGASYKPKEGGRDARMAALMDADGNMLNGDIAVPETNETLSTGDRMEVDDATPAVEEEDDEVDELDAFMNSVQAEVKSVDKADKAKLRGKNIAELDGEDEEEEEEKVSEDEVEKVGMSAAEILA